MRVVEFGYRPVTSAHAAGATSDDRDNSEHRNPLRAILSLALLAFAPWAAGAILGTTTALAGATFLGKVISAGIVFAGQALINAALPLPRPPVLPQASPTYTIGAQGNQARIEQAIPVQYGRLLAWPDFAAQPYTEFAGNEQYLYQLLCLGAGEYDIEEIRIEDTPIAAFAEITTEIIAPGAQVTLFPTNVITSVEVSGQELTGQTAATYSRAGAVITLTQTAHGRAVGQVVQLEFTTGGAPSDVYQVATVPTVDTFTVTAASGAGSGDAIVRDVLGGSDGFVASDAGTVAERLAVDVVLGLGLYATDGDGELATNTLQFTVQARRVDDNGAPLAGWLTLAVETVTLAVNPGFGGVLVCTGTGWLIIGGLSGEAQANTTDSTAGRMMRVGAFGWGANDASAPVTTDLDAMRTVGNWRFTTGAVGAPETNGLLIHSTRNAGVSTQAAQFQMVFGSSGTIWRRLSNSGGTWDAWVTLPQLSASGLMTAAGNAVGWLALTIADDAVGTITVPRQGGYAAITCNGATASPNPEFSGQVYFDAGTTLQILKGTAFAGLSANLNVVTTDLTGTTGTDGFVTVAVQAGVIKIENRAGASKTFQVTFS